MSQGVDDDDNDNFSHSLRVYSKLSIALEAHVHEYT